MTDAEMLKWLAENDATVQRAYTLKREEPRLQVRTVGFGDGSEELEGPEAELIARRVAELVDIELMEY